jgi:hypothetical protein
VQNKERIDNYPADVDKISNKGRQLAFNNCIFAVGFKYLNIIYMAYS